jgi:hypothetical protein
VASKDYNPVPSGKTKTVGLGDLAVDCVFFGQVAAFGSSLTRPFVDAQNRQKKFLQFIPLTCESVRAMATCREILWGNADDRDSSVYFRLGSEGCWEASTVFLDPTSSRTCFILSLCFI